MPMIEQEERSNNEYKRGVSGWNFDLEDLKAQASLVSDRHAESIKIKSTGC
jgi:serine/threonine-protein kinase OSR1/STK39